MQIYVYLLPTIEVIEHHSLAQSAGLLLGEIQLLHHYFLANLRKHDLQMNDGFPDIEHSKQTSENSAWKPLEISKREGSQLRSLATKS